MDKALSHGAFEFREKQVIRSYLSPPRGDNSEVGSDRR